MRRRVRREENRRALGTGGGNVGGAQHGEETLRRRGIKKKGDFFTYFILHCFICRPSDSPVLLDAGIEPRTVALTSRLDLIQGGNSARGGFPQSRQSTKLLFSSRRNWDSPNPSPAGECAPLPPCFGARGTLAGERGGGRVPIPTRGHTLWYSLYITYFVGIPFSGGEGRGLKIQCVRLRKRGVAV